MDIKRISSSPASPEISAPDLPAAKDSAASDQIVPFSQNLMENITSFTSSQNTAAAQAMLEDAFQSAAKLINDPALKKKLEELILAAKDDVGLQRLSDLTAQKAREAMEQAQTNADVLSSVLIMQAVVIAVVAVVTAVFTFGAGESTSIYAVLAEELKKAGVSVDPQRLADITDAIVKGGDGAKIDMHAAFQAAVKDDSKLKQYISDISDAVFPNDPALRGKLNQIGDAIADMKEDIAEIKETIIQIKEQMEKLEEVREKMEKLLPQLMDALGDAAGECLKNVPPENKGDQIEALTELTRKMLQTVQSDEPAVPVSKVDEMKRLLSRIMLANRS